MRLIGALTGLAVQICSAADLRRETRADFVIDPAFQADGGVQLFFTLVDARPGETHRAELGPFLTLDRSDRLSALREPVHVTTSRVSYVVDKAVSFFTRDRLLDAKYMQALAPQLELTSRPDGGFHIARSPANSLSVDVHLEPDFTKGVAGLAHGNLVVVQENVDFARVLGWRTAAWSATWTFHEAISAQQTRITALTLTYLFNVPPPFLGGPERLYADTAAQTLAFVTALRAYELRPAR
ncbi:MAG: hypothetical protein JNM17_24210 [Archangium sp.]|nr:hypothetical protein [Archangium sp.]